METHVAHPSALEAARLKIYDAAGQKIVVLKRPPAFCPWVNR